jgi:hypothetical protein
MLGPRERRSLPDGKRVGVAPVAELLDLFGTDPGRARNTNIVPNAQQATVDLRCTQIEQREQCIVERRDALFSAGERRLSAGGTASEHRWSIGGVACTGPAPVTSWR